MLRAVLFDWGGTLMQDEWNDEIALEGYATGLSALGGNGLPDADSLLRYFREHEAELFSLVDDDEIDIAEVMRGSFAHHGANLRDDDLRLFLQASHEVFASYYQLASTTHALLEALRRRGLRLALVSNTASPEWLLRPVLEKQGLVERLDAIVLSSEVGKRKPHPALFERALSEVGTAPDEALFVGDRLDADVVGAAGVGIPTVQALWFRADDAEVDVDPDFQAFTQMDVLNVVERLSK